MHESKSVFVIEMGMGIDVSFITMGGPSCVTNSNEVVMLSLALVFQPLDAISTEPVAGGKLVELELSGVAVD